jgi:histidinol-phosphate aminotransferase
VLDTYSNLIVLRSFSKGFALAGLRVGYGIANETLVDYLYRAAQFFPVNRLAQVGAIAALNDLEYYQVKIAQMCQERTRLAQSLSKLGFCVYPSVTNFLFLGTKPLGIPSRHLVQELQTKNIYVKDCGFFPGLDGLYFRTSVGSYAENQALLDNLGESIATFI